MVAVRLGHGGDEGRLRLRKRLNGFHSASPCCSAAITINIAESNFRAALRAHAADLMARAVAAEHDVKSNRIMSRRFASIPVISAKPSPTSTGRWLVWIRMGYSFLGRGGMRMRGPAVLPRVGLHLGTPCMIVEWASRRTLGGLGTDVSNSSGRIATGQKRRRHERDRRHEVG